MSSNHGLCCFQVEQTYSRTALMMCGFSPPATTSHAQIDTSCANIANALVNAGADIWHRDANGLTALHMAAARGLGKFVEYLVTQSKTMSKVSQEQHALFLDARDEDGRTALINAISHSHLDTVKVLLKAGIVLLLITDMLQYELF